MLIHQELRCPWSTFHFTRRTTQRNPVLTFSLYKISTKQKSDARTYPKSKHVEAPKQKKLQTGFFEKTKFIQTIVHPYLESICRWQLSHTPTLCSKKGRTSQPSSFSEPDNSAIPAEVRGFPAFILGRLEATVRFLQLDLKNSHHALGLLAAQWSRMPLVLRIHMGHMNDKKLIQILQRLK